MLPSRIPPLLFFLFLLYFLLATNAPCAAQTDARRTLRISLIDRTIEAEVLNRQKDRDYKQDIDYYWCSGQRILRTQGGADGDLLDGSYREFHPNGQLMTKGSLSYGVRNGTWTEWDATGRLLTSSEWKKGRRHGKSFTADPAGGEGKVEHYKNGKLLPEKPAKEKRERKHDQKEKKAQEPRDEVKQDRRDGDAKESGNEEQAKPSKKKKDSEAPAKKKAPKKERAKPNAPSTRP